MCTLIAFHRVWRDAPLVVAANRDEQYDRPASGPRWIEIAGRMALAPRDEVAGGTWMGANVAGTWIGITNRRGPRPPDLDRRSRGLLCLDLLTAPTARDAVAALERLEEPYNPFHVVCGDGEALVLVEYEEGRVEARELGPGCHIVTNEPFEEPPREPKTRRAWALLRAAGLWPVELGSAAPARLAETLGAILADHGTCGPDALCLHGGRYGTRSAAVWRIHPAPGARSPTAFEVAYADGPPCSTRFEPFSWTQP